MRYLVFLLMLPLVFAQVCDVDADCGMNAWCYEGTCQPACMDNEECASGVCDNYMCVPVNNTVMNETIINVTVTNITIVNETVSTPSEVVNKSAMIDTLQSEIKSLSTTTQNLESRLDSIEGKLSQLNSDISSLDNKAELQALQTEIQEAMSNIAALRTNVETTQTDIESVQLGLESTTDTTAFTRILSIVAIIITLTLGISLYIFHHTEREEELDPEIINYITGHIKQGNNHDKIKEHLLKAGWTSDQIEEAYNKVKTHNYHKYLKSQGRHEEIPKKAIDHKKPVIIGSISFMLVMVIILFMGANTGQAVYYTLDSSSTVSDYILHAYENSGFTQMVNMYDICIQFPTYTGQQVSKRFIRTESSYGVYDAATHCWERDTDSFSVLFDSQEDFEFMMEAVATNDPLTMAQVANQLDIIVLPSDYVAPGFYPRQDYTKFCDVGWQFDSWMTANIGTTFLSLFPDCQ